MIKVEVGLYATLRRYRPELNIGEALPVELPAGATVGQLIEQLGLPEKEIKVVFVNGVVQEFDYVLADGDRVGFFPPVGGG